MLYKVKTIKPLLLFSKIKRKGEDPMQTKDLLSRKKTNKTSQFFVTLQELQVLAQLKLSYLHKSWSALIEKSISRTLEYHKIVGY